MGLTQYRKSGAMSLGLAVLLLSPMPASASSEDERPATSAALAVIDPISADSEALLKLCTSLTNATHGVPAAARATRTAHRGRMLGICRAWESIIAERNPGSDLEITSLLGRCEEEADKGYLPSAQKGRNEFTHIALTREMCRALGVLARSSEGTEKTR
jgi:hypothetical protein